MDRQEVRIPRKVIRVIYSASQWSLKRKNYPSLTPDDMRRATGTKLTRAPAMESPASMPAPRWIAVDGEQVMTPETTPWHEFDRRRFPSRAQIEFLETILAWTLRTESLSEEHFQLILRIMREDTTLTPLVPFLLSALQSAAVKIHIPTQRVRMARLADAWSRNVRLHRTIHPHIPVMIAAIRRIVSRGEISKDSVDEMRGIERRLSQLFTSTSQEVAGRGNLIS